MTTIDKKLLGTDNAVYYTDGLRTVFEDMLNIFKTDPTTQQEVIDPHLAYKYEGDFYGLAAEMGVPYNLHWLCMRMSGWSCSSDFYWKRDETQYILKPNLSFVNQQVSIYNQTASR